MTWKEVYIESTIRYNVVLTGTAEPGIKPLSLWINFNKLRLLCMVHSLKYLNNIYHEVSALAL